MRNPRLTAELAAQVATNIRDATYGTGKLLTDYWNQARQFSHVVLLTSSIQPTLA